MIDKDAHDKIRFTTLRQLRDTLYKFGEFKEVYNLSNEVVWIFRPKDGGRDLEDLNTLFKQIYIVEDNTIENDVLPNHKKKFYVYRVSWKHEFIRS